MTINEHTTIALAHDRVNDLHRDAAKIRLAREARRETSTGRTFRFASILRRFAPVGSQPAASIAIKTPTLRRV